MLEKEKDTDVAKNVHITDSDLHFSAQKPALGR